MPMPNLTIVILAAGLSQRLGFAKQYILKNNQTLLAEKIELALKLEPNQVLVVLPKLNNALSRALYEDVAQLPVTVIDNPTPDTGIALSIRLAIEYLQTQSASPHTRVLFLTVDQIALTEQDLVQLTQPVTDTQLIVSCYDNNEPPTFGIPVNLPLSFLIAFAHRLQGDKGFRAMWQHSTQITTTEHGTYQLFSIFLPHLGFDIDTPADFEKAQVGYHLQKNLTFIK